jgi:flagellar hook-associated protein 2
MTTSSTSNAALTSILSGLTNGSSSSSGTSTSGPLITTGQINVSQLVGELMLVNSQPLTRLQNQEAGVKSTLSAYGQEQSALSSLQTAANALALPTAFQAASATVTGSGVSATITGTPASANYLVNVTSLAQAQSVASGAVADPTATIGTGTLTIQPGAWSAGNAGFTASAAAPITITIDSTNDSLSGIASAINTAAAGTVNASVVTDATGSRLVLSSANTGAANGFSVAATGALSQFSFAAGAQTMTSEQTAANASFSVNGLALTSTTNTVSSVISGVTLNLNLPNSTSQIQVGTDPKAVTDSVNGFISAYNSFITLTNKLTSYDSTANSSSVLTGDSATRNMVGSLQSILGSQWSTTGTGPSYLAQIGVSVNTDGTLALDSTKFQGALSANASGVAAMFTTATGTGAAQGFAVQMANAVQQIEGSNGALGSAQANLQAQVVYMNNQQASMQASLAQTQAALTQEYSALNAEISAAQAQQASLTNQLASLPG